MMTKRMTFQDWITISLHAADDVVRQLPYFYLNTSHLQSLTVVAEFVDGSQSNVALKLETAHTLAGPWFQTAAVSSRTPVVFTRLEGANDPLGNYVRWVLEATEASGQICFKLDASAGGSLNAGSRNGAMLFTGMPEPAQTVGRLTTKSNLQR